MALTGKLSADFASFYDAVTQAEVRLNGFESSAAKVEGQLNKTANSLNGSAIVSQATIAAEAVERIGGVSKLTEAELQRLGVVAQEASAKLKAMGQDVPQGIQAIADASKAAAQSSNEMGESWVARIAEGLLLRDAINEVLSKVKEMIVGVPEEAHALHLLSLQTQTNVEDLQVLGAATRAYGVDGDQLGKVLYQLGRRIAGNDESVATAYHLMGMSLDEVRGMNAMDLFLATERGLGKLQGTIRDTAAADLYGGRLGVSMGAFSTGVDEAIDKARKLNIIASEDSVQAAAEYQVAVDRMTASVHAWFIEIEGRAIGGVNVLSDAVTKGASKYDIFFAVLQDGMNTLLRHGQHVDGLATVLDHLRQKNTEETESTKAGTAAHAEAAVALDAHGKAAQFMASLELDAAKPLLAWQMDYLQHLKDIGELTPKTAAGIGVTADQLKRYTAETEAANKATEEQYAAWLKYDELLAHMDKETFTLAQEHEKQWREERLATTARVNAALLLELDAQTKLNAEWGLNAAGAVKLQSSALETLTQKLTELHIKKVEGISQEKEEQLLTNEYAQSLYVEARAQDALAVSVSTTTKAYYAQIDALTIALGLTSVGNRANAPGTGVNQGVNERGPGINQGSTVPINGASGPQGSSFFSLPGFSLSGHADGISDASAGHWAMVGERGPEAMYVPKGSSIFPNGSTPGTSVVNHFYVNGTADDVARQIASKIMRQIMAGQRVGSA